MHPRHTSLGLLIIALLMTIVSCIFLVYYILHAGTNIPLLQGFIRSSYMVNDETNATKTIPAQTPATLLAVGDIMLGRNVERLTNENGRDYAFENITSFFQTFNLVFANLEGPIPTLHRPTPSGSTTFSFVSTTPTLLKRHNIGIVSLANNHLYDQGASNATRTREKLQAEGILTVGDQKVVNESLITTSTINGKNIVFVALYDVFGALDEVKAQSLVKKTADTTDAFVFLSIHWGDEYKLTHNARQERIAHALIDAGADVIVGHHPHVVQDIEMYQNKPIFYSLGNFIFDQYFSTDTQEGLAVGITLTDDQTTYTLFPIDIVKSRAQLMDSDKKTPWLEALAKRGEKNISSAVVQGVITVNADPSFPTAETIPQTTRS